MDSEQYRNAQAGQEVTFFDGWQRRTETVVAVDSDSHEYNPARVITQRGRFYALYTAPNQAPDEVFTSKARLDHITATFS